MPDNYFSHKLISQSFEKKLGQLDPMSPNITIFQGLIKRISDTLPPHPHDLVQLILIISQVSFAVMNTLVNVYVDLLVFTRIAGTS